MANDRRIGAVSVLGAGTMGAQIAAHLANAGLPVLLLDVSPETARDGLKRARGLKPDPFFTRDDGDAHHDRRVRTAISSASPQVTGSSRPSSSNSTSSRISSRRSNVFVHQARSFRRTHPGYRSPRLPRGAVPNFDDTSSARISSIPLDTCRLLELIPTPDTDPSVIHTVSWFADHRLGKGVVLAKDTPNFIANHIGLFGVIQVLRALESGDYTIEEIDAITGPLLGRPSQRDVSDDGHRGNRHPRSCRSEHHQPRRARRTCGRLLPYRHSWTR